jgi:hypothetical protein
MEPIVNHPRTFSPKLRQHILPPFMPPLTHLAEKMLKMALLCKDCSGQSWAQD